MKKGLSHFQIMAVSVLKTEFRNVHQQLSAKGSLKIIKMHT